tara:strand:+ start:17523 stop:18302 length:780 start_codon:yes stop_codon:yes gene_type:complete
MSTVTSLLSKILTDTKVCEKHGEFEATGVPVGEKTRWSPCPDCEAERIESSRERRHRKLIDHGGQVRLERAMEQAAIPKRYRTRTLDTYNAQTSGQKRALSSAKRFADSFEDALDTGANLIMTGRPGTGKTHLAIGIAHQAMREGYTAMFMTTMNAIRVVRETYRNGEKTERKAIQQLAEPDLLILDEVGVQMGTDSERKILFEIINARYENMRPMILISNLDVEGVRSFLGERATDRLREGGGRAIIFDWDSHRGGEF